MLSPGSLAQKYNDQKGKMLLNSFITMKPKVSECIIRIIVIASVKLFVHLCVLYVRDETISQYIYQYIAHCNNIAIYYSMSSKL